MLLKELALSESPHEKHKIVEHCFIYYLNNALPTIEVIDTQSNESKLINELFKEASKDTTEDFDLKENKFKLYITKTLKNTRKSHYLRYCANNRTVGNRKNIKTINPFFCYPIEVDNKFYYIDVYVVSDFLNKKVFKERNGFNIPRKKEHLLFDNHNDISFEDIEEKISSILKNRYNSFIEAAKQKNLNRIKSYIEDRVIYNRFLKNTDILHSIPPDLTDDKLEEYLHRISYNQVKKNENNLQTFVENK